MVALPNIRCAVAMRNIPIIVLLLGVLAGCAERPPFPSTGPISADQWDWYVSKATNALRTDKPFRGWPNRAKIVTIDGSRRINKMLLPDGGTVEIDIPNQKGGPGGSSYVMVLFDRRTGRITNFYDAHISFDPF